MIELFIFFICLSLSVFSLAFFVKNRAPTGPEPELLDLESPAPKRFAALERILISFDVHIQPLQFLAGMSVLALAVFLLFLEFFPENIRLAGIAVAGFVGLCVMLMLDIVTWRSRRFEGKLVDALDLMNAALQGGLAPRQALLVAADASKGVVAKELREIVERLDVGASVDIAIRRMSVRYDSEGVRLFTQALIAKWHSGSDFGALLSAVSDLIRDRVKQRLMVSGQLSGARYGAIFAGILPYSLVPLFLWREPDWFAPLLQHPNGFSFLLTAVILQMLGFFWLRRILRVKL